MSCATKRGPFQFGGACFYVRLGHVVALLLLMAVAMTLSAFNAQAQDEPAARLIPNGLLLTPDNAIQAAEGSLYLYMGPERQPLAPAFWQHAPDGQTAMRMSHDGVAYEVRVHQAAIGHSTAQAFEAAIITVTAEVRADEEREAQFWCAWQHEITPPTGAQGGGLLLRYRGQDAQIEAATQPWQDSWTWFFSQNAFIRHGSVVYFFRPTEGWNLQRQVRFAEPPYSALTPEGRIGHLRCSHALPPQQKASMRLIVPFNPLPIDVYRALNNSQ